MTTTTASECSEGGGGGGGLVSGRASAQLPVPPVPGRPLWPAHLGSATHPYTPFFISNILGLPRPPAFGLFGAPAAAAADEEEPLNLTVRGAAGAGGSPRAPDVSHQPAAEVTELTDSKPAGKGGRKGEPSAPFVCAAGHRVGAISRAARAGRQGACGHSPARPLPAQAERC